MRTILLCCVIVAAGALGGAAAGAVEGSALYVATNGSDAWSGTLPAPNRGKTDGPFATLERARDEIRKQRAAAPLPAGGVTVFVRGGMYALAQTLSLGAEDSGTPDAPVVYRAYAKEKPVVIGGRPITGFVPHKGKILKADVAAQGLRGVAFRQLFFDGKRQHLARYPNFDPKNPYGGGWAYVDGKPVPLYAEAAGDSRSRLHYRGEDARAWAHPEEGEVMVFPRYNWWNNLLRVASVERESRILQLAGEASYAIRPGDRYYVRNLFEELDSPGEWYLDQRTGTLYFWPPAGLNGAAVYAPALETLLRIGPGAAHVTFRGFTLECCEGTAVLLDDASGCLIAGNTIRNVGGRCLHGDSAVAVSGGSGNGVVGNDIYEVGSNAVSLSGGDRKTLAPAGNYAENNYIHHTGVFYKQGVGVTCSGVGNRVSRNLIHDCPRFGISWGGNDHVFEFNHIRHVNLETCDTGGIYSWQVDWSARGSELRYNYFHDVLGYGLEHGRWASPYYAWGIYLDDGTCGTKVYGNIVARAALGGAHVHGGRDNVVENNIFIEGTQQQMTYSGYGKGLHPVPMMTETWNKFSGTPAYNKYPGYAELTRSLEDAWQMAGNKFRRNIICYSNPKARLYQQYNLPADKTESDYNVVWHFGQPLDVGLRGIPREQQWEEWKRLGFEQHSLVADPGFVNAKKDDYRLRPDSPALRLGFQPIPVEKIGPYRDALRASWPIREAEGAREKPLVSEQPLEGFAPNPRNTTPAVAKRAAQPVVVDGVIGPEEWPGAPLAMKESPGRDPISGEPCRARVCHDGERLYVAVTVPVGDTAKMLRADAWGKNDGIEVCLQDLSGARPGPIFVIHGFPGGRHESVAEAGAPESAAARLGEATRFAAKVGEKEWTGEWSLPLAAAGITPRPGLKLAFNLCALRTETGEWVVWVGTMGPSWALEEGGFVVLE